MTLRELKSHLSQTPHLRFRLPDGRAVVAHAHLTEAGETTRRFVDCGGTLRAERAVSLQLWSADDVDHRLSPRKALGILESAGARLGLTDADGDLEVHVEYQGPDTIARYGLSADADALRLDGLTTACLAPDRCGIPPASAEAVDTNAEAVDTNAEAVDTNAETVDTNAEPVGASAGAAEATAAPAFPIAATACVPGQGCC